jgi:peptide/nickel transport system permease protein
MHGSLVTSSLIRETSENESLNNGYKFGQEEETYNIVAAHGYFGRLIFQYARSATVDNLLGDHVRTAVSKGASPGRVLARHVLRNSLTSTVTLIGLTLPFVLSGSLIIEALFNFPGVGLLFWNAAQDRDFPVLLGVVLIVTVATVAGNLLADLGYAALDPRVRYQ